MGEWGAGVCASDKARTRIPKMTFQIVSESVRTISFADANKCINYAFDARPTPVPDARPL